MSARAWKPGGVAMVTAYNKTSPYPAYYDGDTWRELGSLPFCVDMPTSIRRLVFIDPEDREQVERLWQAWRDLAPDHRLAQDNLQAALREFANPKPYREHSTALPPWPEVGECHSRHVDGHECPQCAWEHEHDWVAWTHPDAIDYGVPIRCSKCGGRKCDRDDCVQQRHTHTHHDEVQS